MPRERFGEDHTFLPRRAFLSFEEIEKVVRACIPLGLDKVRLTGGEPLLRPDLSDLVSRLSDLGIDIALTTNGSLLRRNAEALAEALELMSSDLGKSDMLNGAETEAFVWE